MTPERRAHIRMTARPFSLGRFASGADSSRSAGAYSQPRHRMAGFQPRGAAVGCDAPCTSSLLDFPGDQALGLFPPLSGGPSTCGQAGESAPQAERHERRMVHPSAVARQAA